MTSRIPKLVLAFTLLLAGVAFAENLVVNRYTGDPAHQVFCDQVPTTFAWPTALESAPGPSLVINGSQNATVQATTSVAGATISLRIVLGKELPDGSFHPMVTKSYSTAASSSFTIGGRYACPAFPFDTAAQTHARLVVESLSSGNASVEGWAH